MCLQWRPKSCPIGNLFSCGRHAGGGGLARLGEPDRGLGKEKEENPRLVPARAALDPFALARALQG